MVWQNEWTDAVLCKIQYFSPENYLPFAYNVDIQEISKRLLTHTVRLLLCLRANVPCQDSEGIAAMTSQHLEYGCLALGARGARILEVLRQTAAPAISPHDILEYLDQLLCFRKQMRLCRNAGDISVWAEQMTQAVRNQVRLSDEEIQQTITSLLHHYTTQDNAAYRNLYIAYLSNIID